MADRPGHGGPEDGPDFNWLYGGKGRPDADRPQDNPDATRAIRAQPRPSEDPTQMMSAQPRGTARPTPPPVAPPPSAPPPSTSYRGGGRRFPRPKSWIRVVFVLVLLWIVYLVAVPLIAWNKVDKVAFEPDGDRPGQQGGTTYLLVGSDSRGDLTKQQRKQLGTGNAGGQRTDTIMLLHTGSGPNLLMSIPRDSIVDVPDHGTTKINAAFAFGGPELLVQTIENETGIRVDQYVEIGFGGFVDLVDAVNGIEICPDQRMKDKLANLNIKKGCQEADGVTALGYARSRHTSGIGDIDRAKHQREVVSAIGRKVASPWSIVNPFRYWNLNMAATQAVAFGDGTSPWRAAMWASAMTHVDGTDGLTCGVPIADLAVNWDEERSQKLFQAIIDDDTESVDKKLCTPTGIAK